MTIMPSVHYDNLVTKSHSDTDDDDASSVIRAIIITKDNFILKSFLSRKFKVMAFPVYIDKILSIKANLQKI